MIADVKKTAEQKMKKTHRNAEERSLRRSAPAARIPGLLDHIIVDYYGTPTPLPQVANVTLDRRAHDRRYAVGEEDGRARSRRRSAIPTWVSIPPRGRHRARADAGADRRTAQGPDQGRAQEGETARVAVRNVRRDAIHQLKDLLKQKKVAEDEERRAQDDMQKLTDRHIADIDKLLQQKEADLMAI